MCLRVSSQYHNRFGRQRKSYCAGHLALHQPHPCCTMLVFVEAAQQHLQSLRHRDLGPLGSTWKRQGLACSCRGCCVMCAALRCTPLRILPLPDLRCLLLFCKDTQLQPALILLRMHTFQQVYRFTTASDFCLYRALQVSSSDCRSGRISPWFHAIWS